MSFWKSLCALSLLALGCASEPASPAPSAPTATTTQAASAPSAETQSHVLLTLKLEKGALSTLDARVVAEPLPKRKVTDKLPWRFELFDERGERLHQASLAAATELRGEFADANGKLEGVRFVQEDAAFAVRVPSDARAHTMRLFAKLSALSSQVPDGRDPDEFLEIAHGAFPREVSK